MRVYAGLLVDDPNVADLLIEGSNKNNNESIEHGVSVHLSHLCGISHICVAKASQISGSLWLDASEFSNASNFEARKKLQENQTKSNGKASQETSS